MIRLCLGIVCDFYNIQCSLIRPGVLDTRRLFLFCSVSVSNTSIISLHIDLRFASDFNSFRCRLNRANLHLFLFFNIFVFVIVLINLCLGIISDFQIVRFSLIRRGIFEICLIFCFYLLTILISNFIISLCLGIINGIHKVRGSLMVFGTSQFYLFRKSIRVSSIFKLDMFSIFYIFHNNRIRAFIIRFFADAFHTFDLWPSIIAFLYRFI